MRSEAGLFLGPYPVKWVDLGLDIQQAKVEGFLQHLRETNNKVIAEKLSDNQESVYEILRIRTKTIRNRKSERPLFSNEMLDTKALSLSAQDHSAASTELPETRVDPSTVHDLTGTVALSDAGMTKEAF